MTKNRIAKVLRELKYRNRIVPMKVKGKVDDEKHNIDEQMRKWWEARERREEFTKEPTE